MIRTIAGLFLTSLIVSCASPRMGARYFVAMDDAAGLGAAAPVFVSGVRVGTIQTVRLDGNRARVEFDIESTSGVTLREDACASAGWYSGAISPHLKLEVGSDAARALGNGGEIKCVRSSATTAEAEKTLASLRKVLDSALEGKGTVGRLLKDEELAQRVSDYFAKAPPPASPDVKATPALPVPGTPAKTPTPAPKAPFDERR
jgi:ABC-type transporter Mla subunit MlaD